MSKAIALIIGVSNYNIPKVNQLPFCKNDISAMNASVISGLSVQAENIITCGESGTVTFEDFRVAIQSAALRLSEQDTFLFYFSGHGGPAAGDHNLLLSDCPLPTNDVINLLDSVCAKNKIIILDCCYAGKIKVNGTATTDAEAFIDDFAGKGYAVLASSNAVQESRMHPDKPLSLFTSFLCDAISNPFTIREGKKSLNDIHKLLFLMMDVWNRKHPDQAQTPIYRANLGGTIFFHVKDYIPYHSEHYYLDAEKYIIREVQPMHSGVAKRYSVDVILKEPMTYPEIALINHEIVDLVKPLEIYQNQHAEKRWRRKPTNIVFCYYALSETDIKQHNYICHTTWVDDSQDKSWWYREGKNCEFIRGTYFQIHTQYEFVKRFIEEHSGQKEVLIQQEKQIISALITLAEHIISAYNDYRNNEKSETELIEFVKEIAPKVTHLYMEETNLDISPDDLADWSQACMSLAGCIHDFTLYYSNDTFLNRTAENRKACMDGSIKRYYQELEFVKKLGLRE